MSWKWQKEKPKSIILRKRPVYLRADPHAAGTRGLAAKDVDLSRPDLGGRRLVSKVALAYMFWFKKNTDI